MLPTLTDDEFYIDVCDLEVFGVSEDDEGHPVYLSPRNIYLKDACYALTRKINVPAGFGHFHTYSSLIDPTKVICVKVIDETSMLCKDDGGGVNYLSVNNALGEVESYKWLSEVDPAQDMFANRFKPHCESIIGAAGLFPSSRKLLYNLADINAAACDEDVAMAHYTVMELYDGNLFSLMVNMAKARHCLGASREMEEDVLHKVSVLVKQTYTQLKKRVFLQGSSHASGKSNKLCKCWHVSETPVSSPG